MCLLRQRRRFLVCGLSFLQNLAIHGVCQIYPGYDDPLCGDPPKIDALMLLEIVCREFGVARCVEFRGDVQAV